MEIPLTEETITKQNNYSEDVQIINKDGREFIIVGTAHISRQSADLVKEVITKEMPDTVCIELDEKNQQQITTQNEKIENLEKSLESLQTTLKTRDKEWGDEITKIFEEQVKKFSDPNYIKKLQEKENL